MRDKGKRIEDYLKDQNRRTFLSIKIKDNWITLYRGIDNLQLEESTLSIEPYLSLFYSVVTAGEPPSPSLDNRLGTAIGTLSSSIARYLKLIIKI